MSAGNSTEFRYCYTVQYQMIHGMVRTPDVSSLVRKCSYWFGGNSHSLFVNMKLDTGERTVTLFNYKNCIVHTTREE